MSTKMLLPSSSHIPDRYFFHSQSNDRRISSKNRLDTTSPSRRKRYKFSSTNNQQHSNTYKFPTHANEKRSYSSDSTRYYFPFQNPQRTLTYRRAGSSFEEPSGTSISDTPYLFSTTTTTTTKSQKYPSTTTTFLHSEDTWTSQRQQSYSLLSTSSLSPPYRPSTRMDTITSTNGPLSIIKRLPTDKSPSVHFELSSLSSTPRSYLNEARDRLAGRRAGQSPESFDKSVDRLILSVNKKYGHPQQQHPIVSSLTSSSLNYISQYYAKEDEQTIASDDEQQQLYYNLNINRTHTQIMKTVNRSLIDRSYQRDQNRLKHFEQNVRRCLRLFESQSLQRELNYDLIRCFSSSYLHDLRQEEMRQHQTRAQIRSYTYEDIQDIYVPSILEAYKMKLAIDREKHQRLQLSVTSGQLSPVSSSEYSPIMVGSLNENMDTQSGGFETDRRSFTSISQISPNLRPRVDLFYEIMQEKFHGVDASIAGHVSKVTEYTKSKSRQSSQTTRDIDTDIDLKSTSSFWSDEELADQHPETHYQRRTIPPHQRKISRYLSTVNRSLLDHPSDLIADFYLSQLNRNMQESVRHVEAIARDKANQQEFQDYRATKFGRSLSAEHLYQVRKEHLRYKQPFTKPPSFTAEDVADIYKRFVLENYKRKIAIELERRRRERQRKGISHSSMYTSEPEKTPRDFSTTSPTVIVQRKEVIMGRARRTLTNDGSGEIIHRISTVSPPAIYSLDKRSSPQTRIIVTATIDLPDFRHRSEEIIPTPSRPQTKLYTTIPQTKPIEISRARRRESANHDLSFANIQAIITLNQHEINSLTDQSYNDQISQYTELKPEPEQSTLIISYDEHIPRLHEEIPLIEFLPTTNPSLPTITRANEISADSGISFNTSHINEPPTIFNASFSNEFRRKTEINNEPLPEHTKTIVINETLYDDPLNESTSLASLLEELPIAIHKKHARQIIDENYYWKTREKVEENTRIPIIVYDTEWRDENTQIISSEYLLNTQNARYIYPENMEYECVKINTFATQQILDNDEQVTSLSDDFYLLRQQQQSHIHLDQSPILENPLHSRYIFTLNYPHHHKNQGKSSINSQTSSLLDMETFLNNFEESLDHEQHLPLIDQISLSYATSMIERNQQKYRSLPIEWFQPRLLSHDEELVEQWIVERIIDTIQQDGTLNRQQVEFLTNTECENVHLASSTNAFCLNEDENLNNSTSRESNHVLSHCSPTSDYETDSVEKDNDTATSTVIIPITILPSSSITNPTLLSQSSSFLTPHTAPIAPIVYFLDVLALEEKEVKNSTKDFLLTIGFGQNPMNEITNTVSTLDHYVQPTWINRSTDQIQLLPTSIHHENHAIPSPPPQQIHFAIENQIEEDDTALLIYPHRLQYGHQLGENTQAPLSTFFEPASLRLPLINEIYTYQMSFHTEFPFFYPPDALPHILVPKTQEDEILSSDEYHINQPKIFALAQFNSILDNEEETEAISMKLDQPTYIEHYHIQSLFPFPETCYADINQLEIITDKNFLSNFLLTKPLKSEDDDLLIRFMGENFDDDQRAKQPELNLFKSPSPIEVRPPTPNQSGSIYEGVKMRQDVDVNMGANDQYSKRSDYVYGSEKDLSQEQEQYFSDAHQERVIHKQDEIFVPEQIIEHISEDEKSTSSEEVVFEEWTEEFRCRRTDEFDRHTNKLLRTIIDETSDRVKGDVIKEQYKGKNTRIKGHRSYDVVKEVYRRAPTHIYEEIPQPPHPRASSKDRHWASEETYTTEIVHDPNLAKELDSLTHYNRVRSDQYSPSPPIIETIASTPYDRMSNVVTPTLHYDDKRKQDQEEVVSEEYHVEFQTPTNQDDLTSSTRRTSDWRNKMKQIYTPPSEDDQYKNSINGNYLAQRVSITPSNTHPRFKEVQIKLPGSDKTPPERRKVQPLPPARHTVKEVLVCVSRGSSPEKQYHSSSIDENEQKKKKIFFLDSESPKDVRSTSATDDEHRTYSRVGELKNTFETTTTTGNIHDDTIKSRSPISTGLTEQRRRIFEDQEWTRRPINEHRMSETHTGPSLVSDRVSRIENFETRFQSTDRRKGFDTMESSTPQTSMDIKFRHKQIISSIDSDLSGPTKPIYHSTPKSFKQAQHDDAGHESEDELSDPKQNYDTRRRTAKTRLRDFSQSTPQQVDTIQRTTSTFNENNMENILSHVPTSKGKGMLIELSPQSPSKSNLMSDSGVFDYSTTTHQLPPSSPSWRQSISTSVIDDTTRSRDTGIYIDSTITTSPYTRRETSDADQTTIHNVDESTSRSIYRYDREIIPNQQQYQQRIVRRQLTNSPPTGYENLSSYHSHIDPQGKVSITTQSRSIKPYVVDEIETIETETQVECEIQRTNETKESTRTERLTTPINPSKNILPTTTSRFYDETTAARREQQFQPIQRDHSQDELPYQPSSHSYSTGPHTMKVTSLSPTNQITFNKRSPNEIVAVVRVPELSNRRTESNKPDEEHPRLHYQRVYATSYQPPLINPNYQQRQSRLRNGSSGYNYFLIAQPSFFSGASEACPSEIPNNYSSPINFPVRSASYHTTLHDQNQQSQAHRPQTRHHSSSLGNLFGSNLEFEIEIEKRPPQHPEQPVSISLDQASRAVVTTSKDGRVSIQNVAAYPGNTVVINSDFHSSDRSLNRSSGYFSSDEPRSQGHTTNYSSDEQSTGAHRQSPLRHSQIHEQSPRRYQFDHVNQLVQNYSQPRNHSTNFNETIDQLDSLYNNLDVQGNHQQKYDFSKLNRRRQLTQNPTEYSKRYTSTGFQQIPSEQQTTADQQQNWTSSLTNLTMATPSRPSPSLSSSGILADYGTSAAISPNSVYGSTQNINVYQNRLNGQAQIVQRHRTSVKQVKQKSAAKRRNGNTQGAYSDEDDENDSPLSDNGRSQPSSRSYYYNNQHQ